jgi:hypothetical protein
VPFETPNEPPLNASDVVPRNAAPISNSFIVAPPDFLALMLETQPVSRSHVVNRKSVARALNRRFGA